MKKLIILFFLLFGIVYGQTSTHEKPVSLLRSIPPLTINEQTQKVMPNLDMSSIEREDEEDRVNGIIPRFGYKHEVSFNLNNSGEWVVLPNGDKIWRLSIVCPNATSINLLYDKFWIPEGVKFFIYSNNYQHQLGAFTSTNNRGKKDDNDGFSTGLIRSEQITLEYFVPKEVEDVGVISIREVVHGYRGFGSQEGDNENGNCCGFPCSPFQHTNVNCPAGNNWQKEKNAVVMIIVNGNRHCSGSLVNTTANDIDNRHFILTAEHCLKGNLANWIFNWHFESPDCNNPNTDPPLISTVGAKLVAKGVREDFALLELFDNPAEQWDVTPYYLGWDRSDVPANGGKLIHHPLCDIKKIVGAGQLEHYEASYPYCNPGIYSYKRLKTHWITYYDKYSARPEPGSSGSPLFNLNHKVIGTVTDSRIMCGWPPAPGSYYYEVLFGKVSFAWEGYWEEVYCEPKPATRLKDWLDPVGGGTALTMEGRGCQKTIKLWHSIPQAAYHAVEKIISRQIIPSGVSTTYKAGEEIVLEDGFHAEAGSNFHAIIEEHTACIPPPRANAPSQNNEQDEEFAFQTSKSQSMQHQFSYELYLHPNPNRGTFQMETNFPLSEISHLKITNTLGLTVYETRNLASNEIQLPNSVSGLYFVVMVLKDGTVLTQKMMVQR